MRPRASAPAATAAPPPEPSQDDGSSSDSGHSGGFICVPTVLPRDAKPRARDREPQGKPVMVTVDFKDYKGVPLMLPLPCVGKLI